MLKNTSRRPEWLRKEKILNSDVLNTRKTITFLGLHTVCTSARCPNLSECYSRGVATFMILGDICTRNCGFCSVNHGIPAYPNMEEGEKIAEYIKKTGIRFCVITSVTRDDLGDGGADHFKRVVEDIKREVPGIKIELLVPDFGGNRECIDKIMRLPIEVFAHNVETVERLYPTVRKGADYRRSLKLLKTASDKSKRRTVVKSGIMLGLGETREDLEQLFKDLTEAGVEILTMGQYLQPTMKNLEVKKYYKPEEFEQLKELALKQGISSVVAGPYVRSSYLAEEAYIRSLKKNV